MNGNQNFWFVIAVHSAWLNRQMPISLVLSIVLHIRRGQYFYRVWTM